MSGSVFTPRMSQEPQENEVSSVKANHPVSKQDDAGNLLQKVSQYAVICLVGLLPVFFMPGLWASLGFDKTILTITASAVVVIASGLLVLRRKYALSVMPISLALFWGLVLVSLLSGLLSGDVSDAIRGSFMETQTVGFLGVMALAMTIPLVLQGSKTMSIKALAVFSTAASLLLTYNVIRLFFGASFLPLGSFIRPTISPIGGFNDLAVFAGLIVILGLVTLAQLPLRGWIQYAISGLVVFALITLSVVNFFNIWVIIGFFGLLLFVYLISKDTLFQTEDQPKTKIPRSLVLTTLAVCLTSALFIVAGDYAGSKLNSVTGIEYVEVRPSLEATTDIIKSVYSEDILLGAGPNRFQDSWRMYKDQSINETIFWQTNFNAGSGYIPTMFANLGILGVVVILMFHAMFLYSGYKMLLKSTVRDPYWYYFGVASFAAALFLWMMTYIYVPGAAILLLASVFTGMTFVASGALMPASVKTIPLAVNRQRGFFLMAAVILLITASVGVLFSVGEQYVAQARYSEAQATATSIEEFEQASLASYTLYQDDRFLGGRAQIYYANLTAIVNTPNPTEEVAQRFAPTAESALLFAGQAAQEDPTNPTYQAMLAGIFSNISVTGVQGSEQARERSETALAEAKRLDPKNPSYHLLGAQIAARNNDIAKAREEIIAALRLKRNYTEALLLSAQLDIAEGNAESAIATTRAIISLEPNNQTRYFQLGVLLASSGDFAGAVSAYNAAVTIDPNYANARYFKAIALLNLEQTEAALTELKIVEQTNQENVQLKTLIEQIETGNFTLDTQPAPAPEEVVNDNSPTEGFGNTVISETGSDTDLVKPVNTVSGNVDDTENQSSTEVVPTDEAVVEDVEVTE